MQVSERHTCPSGSSVPSHPSRLSPLYTIPPHLAFVLVSRHNPPQASHPHEQWDNVTTPPLTGTTLYSLRHTLRHWSRWVPIMALTQSPKHLKGSQRPFSSRGAPPRPRAQGWCQHHNSIWEWGRGHFCGYDDRQGVRGIYCLEPGDARHLAQ